MLVLTEVDNNIIDKMMKFISALLLAGSATFALYGCKNDGLGKMWVMHFKLLQNSKLDNEQKMQNMLILVILCTWSFCHGMFFAYPDIKSGTDKLNKTASKLESAAKTTGSTEEKKAACKKALGEYDLGLTLNKSYPDKEVKAWNAAIINLMKGYSECAVNAGVGRKYNIEPNFSHLIWVNVLFDWFQVDL